jgi:hypothetical protein
MENQDTAATDTATQRLVDRATADGLIVLTFSDPDPEIRAAAWRGLGFYDDGGQQ